MEVDYVVEASDRLRSATSSVKHIEAGAARVLIAAPTKTPDVVPTFAPGVNLHRYHKGCDQIVSLSTPAAQCVCVVAKVMHERFGIEGGTATFVRSVGAGEPALDAAGDNSDLRAGRGTLMNIVPLRTGAVHALDLVMPEVRGRVAALDLSVPVADVSLLDLTLRLGRAASDEGVADAMLEASQGDRRFILGYTGEPVVSSDFRNCSYSAVFDATASRAAVGNLFKCVAWYDAEWGYANRVVDMLKHMARVDGLV